MDPFDLVGDVLDDQYRIDECAGEGVLSVVYRGRHLGVDADVAVKCLNLPPTMDEALAAPVAETFRQGCKLHYRLARGNLHIAQTIASGTTIAPRTGTVVPYLVREWFEGESLAKNFLQRREDGHKGRTLEEVLDLFQGAADALRYAHSQQVSHLSLTPSNFFLTNVPLASQPSLRAPTKDAKPAAPQRTIKVLDFGVGRTIDVTASDLRKSATPSPGLHLLTPSYAAPEQLSAQFGLPGPASDVYVFALVLLEALSDRVVMDGKDTGQIVARALDRTVRPGPRQLDLDLPPQVEAIFDRALSLDPSARFADVGEFWEELLHADVEITSSTRDPSLPPPNFDEEEPTAEMPVEMLEPLAASRAARESVSEGSAAWEHSAAATARIRGPSLFRRLRHWKTLGAKGKSAAEEAEREEGPISMPPAMISVGPGPDALISSPPMPLPPKAPAIPSWHPSPSPPKATDLKPTVKVAVLDPLPSQTQSPPAMAPAQRSGTVPLRPAVVTAKAPKIEAQKPLAPLALTGPIKSEGPRPAPAKAEPKVEPVKAEAPKPTPVKAEPPKVEPVKAEAPKPAAAKPPVPRAPMAPVPKRQPTLVMFEHGVDASAVARTSSPSSPGLADPVAAAAVAAHQAAVEAAPAPVASAAPPPLPAPPAPAPAPATSTPPPDPVAPIKTPGKPLPPPPPTDVLSVLEGMEAAPVAVPAAPPPPHSERNLPASTATAPMPWTVSAPPPAASGAPPQPQLPLAPTPDFSNMEAPSSRSAPTDVTVDLPPDSFMPPAPVPAAPDSSATAFNQVPPPRRNRAVIAAVVSFMVVLALGLVAVVVMSSHKGTTPIPSAATTAVTPSAPPSDTTPPSATVTASAPPSVTASASAPPSAVASAPVLPTQPKFFKNLAMKALDKVAKDLSGCAEKKGLWGQSAATVYFLNDGTVKDVTIADPYNGRSQGKCVADRIRTARMAPFLGKPYPVVYYFVIPR